MKYFDHSVTQSGPNTVKFRKVTTLVTFGFSSLSAIATFGGSLLSEGHYFRVAKTCTVHGPFEVNKIATKFMCMVVLLLEKKV